MHATHKFTVGQIVMIGDIFRGKIVSLEEWYSETLKMHLPKYQVQTFLGNTDIPDTVMEVREHNLTILN